MKSKPTTDIPWIQIQEAATNEALNSKQLAARFNVKYCTIRQAVTRGKLLLVSRLIPRLQRNMAMQAAENAVSKKMDEWAEKGEKHRKMVFDLSHESLKKMKPMAPRSFREAEAADKMARRAAGLDVADTVNQTLININEAMEDADQPRPIEATDAEIVEPRSLPEPTAEEPAPATAGAV